MCDILLTNSYFYPLDEKQWDFGQPYPPLGTITVGAFLKQNGYTYLFHDNNLQKDEKKACELIELHKPKYLVIYDDGFNYLTKMCLTTMREAAFRMIKKGKEEGVIVICNSSDSTDHFNSYLEQGADYIIHGEGEHSLVELLDALNKGEDVSGVAGVSYLKQGHVFKNSPRSVEKDLSLFPMADWDVVDIDSYRNIWVKKHGYFSLNLATTRGCPYKCNWCAKPIYGNRYNSRPPELVMNEIQYLIENYGVQYFWMCDDIFGLKPNWVQQFLNAKKERNLEFQYKIQSRVDLMLKDDNLDALVQSGADMIWVGAESGSQKILDAMDKGTKVEQIYEATKNLKERGAKIAFFLQFGYPGETIADIKKTINMVLELMPDDIGISVSYPLPGTKFYEKVKSQLKVKSNWSDSDDLDLMFENTFKPDFYKVLHRYVHNRYRIKKGLIGLKRFLSFKGLRSESMDIARMIYHLPLASYHHLLLGIYAKK